MGAGGATTCDQQQLQAAAETAKKNCIYLDLFVHRPRYDICTCMEKHDLIDFAVLIEKLRSNQEILKKMIFISHLFFQGNSLAQL